MKLLWVQLAPGSLQRDSCSVREASPLAIAPVEVGSRHQFGLVQICVGSIKRNTAKDALSKGNMVGSEQFTAALMELANVET